MLDTSSPDRSRELTGGLAPVPHEDVAEESLGASRRRGRVWIGGLLALLLVSVLVAVTAGSSTLSIATVARVIGHHTIGVPAEQDWSAPADAIVWQVRLPRVVLGAFVGAALAVCGVALQAMVRNVLADPYLLGVNSGASSGAAAAILFGVGAGFAEYALQTMAFLGALAASLLVFLVARSAGRVTSVRLLLAGVAVGYALYALTSFLIFASDSAEGSRSVMFWLLGSLALAAWGPPLIILVIVVSASMALLMLWGRHLDVLAVGDETAHTLGIRPDRFRLRLLVVVALCVGVAVAAAGSIGFVGLVVPHLARRAVGGMHARVVPVAALMGAVLLIWADLLARTVFAPQELPIGIITALLGAPFLLVLIRRMHVTSA